MPSTTTDSDRATNQLRQAQAILNLVNAGFDRESIVKAIDSDDWSSLRPTRRPPTSAL